MDAQLDFYQADLAYRRERLLQAQAARRVPARLAARQRVLRLAADFAARRSTAAVAARADVTVARAHHVPRPV